MLAVDNSQPTCGCGQNSSEITPFKPIMGGHRSPCLQQIGEFNRSLLSCYLLSNENTPLAAKQGDRCDRIVIPRLESQEIHQAGDYAAFQREFGPLSPARSDPGEESKNH